MNTRDHNGCTTDLRAEEGLKSQQSQGAMTYWSKPGPSCKEPVSSDPSSIPDLLRD